jgi:predicted Zn-dependent peptidase
MKKIPPKDRRESFAEIRTLHGGGQLAIEVMPGMESFTLGFFFRVGAADEDRSLSGISHFIEHMVFKGSGRRSARQIVQAVERVGGLINASTGREVTYYYVRVGSSRLELALDILTDLVFNPVFDPSAMEREKGVILEEMRMNEDDPEQALFDRFLLAIHGNTSYGRTILGNESTIKSFNPETVREFHRKRCSPSRLMASIAGGIDPDKVQNLLEKRLKRFPSGSRAPIRLSKPPAFKGKVLAHSKDFEQSALLVGFPSTGILSPERYAYSILDAISAGGMMSRLFQEIREKRGLVYSIDSTHQPYTSAGIFTIDAGMNEKNIIKVLRLIIKEFMELSQTGPGPRELADAKLYLLGHWALGLESTSARMIRNAMSTVFFNRLLPHDEVIESLNKVTREDVRKASARFFENGAPSVGVLSRFENGAITGEVEEKIRALIDNPAG